MVAHYGDIDVVQDCGADPTWAAYSDKAFASGIAALQPGQVLGIPPGLYKIAAPLIFPPHTGAVGGPGTVQVGSWSEFGSVIKPAADFAQGSAPLNAVILLLDQVTGGYSMSNEDVHLRDLLVTGSALPTGNTVHGLASYGSVGRVQLERVHLARMGGTGLWQDWTEGQPGGWSCSMVFSRYNGGHGFRLRSADSNWTKCLATNAGLNGWELFNCTNGQFHGCRSEWSGQEGYHYTTDNAGNAGSGSVLFCGCTTDRSTHNGFLVAGSAGASIPLTLCGCVLRRDGSDGGNNRAGINVTGYSATVAITGCEVHPGSNDDGTGRYSPYNAIRATSGSRLQLSGGYLQSTTSPWYKDGTSSIVYPANGVTFARGNNNAPVIVAGP